MRKKINHNKKKLLTILLLEDIPNLGKKNTTSTVKVGYANNFLIPRKKAVYANQSILDQLNKEKESALLQSKQIREKALNLKDKIENISIFEIQKRLKDNLYTFSKVTHKQIINEVMDQIGMKIEDINTIDIIDLPEIKKRDDYALKLRLHKEVEANIVVRVVPE